MHVSGGVVVLWRLGRETGVMQGPRFVRCAVLGGASSWRCAFVLVTRPCGAMPSGTELRVPKWRHALVLAVRLRDAVPLFMSAVRLYVRLLVRC